ncbi:MAG TPA: zinc ribbon domain-containing protein [Vicinamibacteria bacterium]|jgi:hypothetical protein
MATTPSACPRCQRPIAAARSTCLYCGAELPPEAVPRPAEPAPAEPAAAARPDRTLVVVRLEGASVTTVERALRLTAFEAEQRVRRGGLQLLRLAPRDEGEREAARLGDAGLAAWAIPEDEARAEPLLARGGRRTDGGLRLTLAKDNLSLSPADLLLVVRGPITRERQAQAPARRLLPTATPAPGYRVHLWRREEPRPVELDPDAFDFGLPGPVPAQLQLLEWIEALRGSAPLDDEFRREPPVLSPAADAEGAEALLRGARERSQKEGGPVILDNLAQFRFFSGWRAAVERRRRGGSR